MKDRIYKMKKLVFSMMLILTMVLATCSGAETSVTADEDGFFTLSNFESSFLTMYLVT